MARATGHAVGAALSIQGAAFKGRRNAPVTVVEFSDFECPFCRRHAAQTLPDILREYVETGKIKYVFRNYPLNRVHKMAFQAAQAGECANQQGHFWPMHDRLFGSPVPVTAEGLFAHSAAVGLRADEFRRCVASGRSVAQIRKDIADARAIGIHGTPAFVLGKTILGGETLKVDGFVAGAKPFSRFRSEIDKLLR